MSNQVGSSWVRRRSVARSSLRNSTRDAWEGSLMWSRVTNRWPRWSRNGWISWPWHRWECTSHYLRKRSEKMEKCSVSTCVASTYDDQQGCGNGCSRPSKSATDEAMMRCGKARANERIKRCIDASCHDWVDLSADCQFEVERQWR